MRNLELIISYVGTPFFGWQIQPNRPTVQGLLHGALGEILNDPHPRTVGCSRTDTGVHAHDQHVTYQTEHGIPPEGLLRALNHRLPPEIRVRAVREREPGYSARHKARGKHYAYYIYNGDLVAPFVSRYLWRDNRHMDDALMHEAARHMIGTRCFKALQASDDHRPHTTTSIYEMKVSRTGRILRIDVTGHHFLYHMVRNMVGSLAMVGRGEWSPAELAERLNQGDRTLMGSTAPAQGLHLIRAFYDDEPVIVRPESRRFADFLDLGTRTMP